MTTKTKETSRILEAVHETARDLHGAGFVSKRRMKDYLLDRKGLEAVI